MKEIFYFIQSIVASLAWPVTTIILALILKNPIQSIFNRLNKLKYGEAEASFETELKNLKQSADSADIKYDESSSVKININKTLLEEVEQVANISPHAAIPLAWSQVESEISNLILRLAISPDYPMYNSPLKNIELLKQNGYLDENIYRTIISMRKLRNNASHAHETGITITTNEAIEYGKLAEAITKKLKEIIR